MNRNDPLVAMALEFSRSWFDGENCVALQLKLFRDYEVAFVLFCVYSAERG